ncbi:MAG: hypothetical protein ABEL04_08610 [Salinibacter sp.]|uniref:hypothetical protein n=1 Tax=Salinibacter sp. TaxID=2065818 RepID=UPI0035D45576
MNEESSFPIRSENSPSLDVHCVLFKLLQYCLRMLFLLLLRKHEKPMERVL